MNDDYSCVKKVVKTVTLSLPSTFISQEVAGVTEILDSWKRQYVSQLGAVVVNYKNVTFSTTTGFIGINRPFVHYNVTATFDLFCPKIGDIVKGKINRFSRAHIGLLVENTINVSIPLSCDSDDFAPYLNLNQVVLFEITHFEFKMKIIRVIGKITPKCLDLMKVLFPPKKRKASTANHNGRDHSNSDSDVTCVAENIVEPFIMGRVPKIEPLSDGEKSKSPKKRKRKDNDSAARDTSDMSSQEEMPKKKKKRMNDSDSTVDLNRSPVTSSRKKKKRRDESSLDLSQSSADERPRKKKKKKHDTESSLEFSESSFDFSHCANTSADEKPKKKKKKKREKESSLDLSETSPTTKKRKPKKTSKDEEFPIEIKEEPSDESPSIEFAASSAFTEILNSIKTEELSPKKTAKSKKRKRESSASDASSVSAVKNQKKKSSSSKKKKIDSKNKGKGDKDPAVKKSSMRASGSVLKKDKKKSKKSEKHKSRKHKSS